MRLATFLSASVPNIDRGQYHETANPFLIQLAVRELVLAILPERRLIWGGHPAITPMIRAVCESLAVDVREAVTLYQSKFFAKTFPAENEQFEDIVLTEAVNDDRASSLLHMRRTMLSRDDIDSAVFIGGMEGILDEYHLFKELRPNARVFLLCSPGGATHELCHRSPSESYYGVDFSHLFRSQLSVSR